MEQQPQTWAELVQQTRYRLGLTREEFSALIGISISALGMWEYRDIIPPPIYQNLISHLYINHKDIRKQLDANKNRYVYQVESAKSDTGGSGSEFWKGVIAGGIAAGVLGLLMGAGSKGNKSKQKQSNQQQGNQQIGGKV